MKKEQYTSPRILKRVEILLERDFLGSLITSDTKVVSAGQETKTIDMSGTAFNHDWGVGE